MALKSTVFRFSLAIADIDRGYYQDHSLTVARHPSENDARMMTRLLAFALNAAPGLDFSRGLSTAEEPALWSHTDAGDVDHWIDLGQPEPKRLRRACATAARVTVYSPDDHATARWWQRHAGALSRLDNLAVIELPQGSVDELAALAARGARLDATIQDGAVTLGDGSRRVTLEPRPLYRGGNHT